MSLRVLLCLSALLLTCMVSVPANAQLRVAASIKPLQLIAAAITSGTSEPGLILPSSQSSHHASLRPSGRRLMAEADLVIWLGPALEGSLIKVTDVLDSEILTVQTLAGMELQYLEAGEGATTANNSEKTVDPHLWLSLRHAKIIAKSIAQVAARIDLENASLYMSNLQEFEKDLAALDDIIRSGLSNYSEKMFAVYHNALQYFELEYGLQHPLSFTEFEEHKPGIKKILQVKKQLERQAVNCLLVEPEINISELNSLLENTKIRYLAIDIMGNDLSIEENSYLELIRGINNIMLECLK